MVAYIITASLSSFVCTAKSYKLGFGVEPDDKLLSATGTPVMLVKKYQWRTAPVLAHRFQLNSQNWILLSICLFY